MPRASELNRGTIVAINDRPYIVNHIDMKAPSSRGADSLYKARYRFRE